MFHARSFQAKVIASSLTVLFSLSCRATVTSFRRSPTSDLMAGGNRLYLEPLLVVGRGASNDASNRAPDSSSSQHLSASSPSPKMRNPSTVPLNVFRRVFSPAGPIEASISDVRDTSKMAAQL